MSSVYQYSIIRFRPSADLGEFANIGVVALDSQNSAIGYRLARVRFRRLREFFGEQAYRAYGAAIEYLRLELSAMSAADGFWARWNPEKAFSHLTRQHESSIVFSEARNLLSNDRLEAVLDSLYDRFIDRQRQEAHDLDLIKNIRHELASSGIKGFRAIRIPDEIVPVTFPLAYKSEEIHAIQPIVFTQKSPLSIFDHGTTWKRRFGYLLDQKKIRENSIILAIEPPPLDAQKPLWSAYREAMSDLNRLPFEAVDAEVDGHINHKIVEFAQSIAPKRHLILN